MLGEAHTHPVREKQHILEKAVLPARQEGDSTGGL